MTLPQIYEGTLDEIVARYGKELNGRRLKVIVDDDAASANQKNLPFYETATPEEWSRALSEWAASHDATIPLLSDDAVERESIYEERGK